MDANRLCCAIVALACEITAWMQMLALNDHPARLRLRLLATPGRLTTSSRRTTLHLAKAGAWTAMLLAAITTLRALRAPAC